MENAQIADLFDEAADLLELTDGDPFRIRSYRGAAQTVRGRKQNIAKALYVREEQPSLLRAGGTLIGAGLIASGLGHSQMVGRALGAGLKAAQSRGSTQAVEAVRLAEAARGVLRRGMAPSERAVRQIQAVDPSTEGVILR